jgi:hypothetical protein
LVLFLNLLKVCTMVSLMRNTITSEIFRETAMFWMVCWYHNRKCYKSKRGPRGFQSGLLRGQTSPLRGPLGGPLPGSLGVVHRRCVLPDEVVMSSSNTIYTEVNIHL